MEKNPNIKEREEVVVKFAGDSGDGMQLTGTLFSDTMALAGNALSTFPDYPAEIRPPHNTIAGVSGYQVRFGSTNINSSGDFCDVLVALNAASLKKNVQWVKKGGLIITDKDAFDEVSYTKAGYTSNPLEGNELAEYKVIDAFIHELTKKSIEHLTTDNKIALKSRNMFALGLLYNIFGSSTEDTISVLTKKFKKKPELIDINKAVLNAGFAYGETIEAVESRIMVSKADLEPGKYRNITGNIATAWGLLAASEKSGRPLFLGSYPITPATEILIELSNHKSLGAKVFQAEDEIAGICSAIGASFVGSLACTTTSGPGLSLKSEALGLAVITELPLVIVNVQRGGPSTGLPTKSEQSDLYQALYGRNGEAPLMVLAASTPDDCFYYAYMAAKYAMEHMTPVILLTDGYIGQGSRLMKIPKVADLPSITPPIAEPNSDYKPYRRDPETLVRQWAIPGTEGLRHRIGGLEKSDIYGEITTDPINHEKMVQYREDKIQRIANFLPEQEVMGKEEGDLLVVSWGGSVGAVSNAVEQLQKEGYDISHAHFHYIMPLPKNTEKVLKSYKRIIVCELNAGQFVNYLRINFPYINYMQYNKVQGQPFLTSELVDKFKSIIK